MGPATRKSRVRDWHQALKGRNILAMAAGLRKMMS
jgi:hypothetical protein